MLTAPSVKNDEIKALEGRPPQNGRTAMDSSERLATKKRRPACAGDLVRPCTCEFCREVGCLGGHYPEHLKPLSVKWACRQCHQRLHAIPRKSR